MVRDGAGWKWMHSRPSVGRSSLRGWIRLSLSEQIYLTIPQKANLGEKNNKYFFFLLVDRVGVVCGREAHQTDCSKRRSKREGETLCNEEQGGRRRRQDHPCQHERAVGSAQPPCALKWCLFPLPLPPSTWLVQESRAVLPGVGPVGSPGHPALASTCGPEWAHVFLPLGKNMI